MRASTGPERAGPRGATPEAARGTPGTPEPASPWARREAVTACLVVVQAPGVSLHLGLCGRGLAVAFLRHEDRLLEVQGVQEVTGTEVAPIVEELCQRDVLASPEVPRLTCPARGRVTASDTLEERGLAALQRQDPVDFLR